MPPVTRALLIANVAVYFLQTMGGFALVESFGLWPVASGLWPLSRAASMAA